MKIFAETDRLIIREIGLCDEAAMFELDNAPEVHRYLGKKPVTDVQQVRAVIHFIRQQYIDNGIGRWAIVEKQSMKFIGWTGLKLMKKEVNDHINYYDLGYRLIKRYWGMGYATESAKASLDYGFNIMQLKEVFAMAEMDNISSANVLQKTGLTFKGIFSYDGVSHNWFHIINPAQ